MKLNATTAYEYPKLIDKRHNGANCSRKYVYKPNLESTGYCLNLGKAVSLSYRVKEENQEKVERIKKMYAAQ